MADTLDIPISNPNGGAVAPQEKVSVPIDDTISKAMDQNFTTIMAGANQAAARSNAGDIAVAELTRNIFLKETQQVGVRESEAMRRMDDNKLASDILAQRSASVQPALAGTILTPATASK